MDDERFNEVYAYLVEQTENPSVLRNKRRITMLSALLDVFEYLRGGEDENPVPDLIEG